MKRVPMFDERRRPVWSLGAVGASLVVLSAAMPMRTGAQRVIAVAPEPSAVNARAVDALLARPVTVDVDRASLKRVLDVIAAGAKVRVQYQADLVEQYTAPITLHVTNMPLRDVFDRILTGTPLRVVPLRDGSLGVVASSDAARQRADEGGIRGTVTNAETRRPVPHVAITIRTPAATRSVVTDDKGQYQLSGLVAGEYLVSIRAIGFARQSRTVRVTDNQVTTVDFALAATTTTLDQVVVTATGAQRYRELGHVVTQINADSLVREAPITSLSELLTARVPGLQVTGMNGASVGGEVALHIRGTTTTSLDPQPIVIVDGIRYKNTNYLVNGDGEDQRPWSVEPRSPLNDLNVNDIETVEVVKGPSASTLYGPDAANGVIVITTKRGHAGKPQWHVYAYPDLSTLSIGSKNSAFDVPQYQGWGHVPNTTDVYQGQCTLLAQATQQCVLDSLVAVPSPTNNAQLSVLAKQRPQWHSGASVSGGSGTQTYFLSGNYDSQTGSLQLPPIAESFLIDQLGVRALSDAIKSPNTQQTLSLHMNVSTAVGAKNNVAITGEYVQGTQRNTSVNASQNYTIGSPLTPGIPYTTQDSLNQLAQESNLSVFLQSAEMQIHHLTAAFSGTSQPFSWLTADARLGVDLNNTVDQSILPANAEGAGSLGFAFYDTRDNTNRDFHLGATAVAHPGIWSLRTSLGMDYGYTNQDGLNASGQGLAPGSADLSTAASFGTSRVWGEVAKLGGYAEEVVGLHDRLFLTGSFRLDGSTTFGDAYVPRPYPKLGLSWVASDEPWLQGMHRVGLDELRFRASYGASSRYPSSSEKFGRISVSNQGIEGTTAAEFTRTSGANPTLRPERSRESEWGAEATIASNVRIGLTWYNRRTNDMLQFVAGPPGLLAETDNLGDLSAHGFEATVGVRAFTSSLATLDLNFSYANHTDKVLSLGSALPYMDISNSYAVGYPLGASFGTRTIGYVDSAGGGPDGYISALSELVSSPMEYLGTNFAPRTYALTPSMTLFGARLRLSSLIDGQRGGVQINGFSPCGGNYYSCPAFFLKSTPLAVQAVNLGVNVGDFVQSSDFTRWRELSLTGELPLAWRERVHLSHASMSLQVRNLALWPKAVKTDPESTPGLGTIPSGTVSWATPGYGAPFPRSWTIRFDIMP